MKTGSASILPWVLCAGGSPAGNFNHGRRMGAGTRSSILTLNFWPARLGLRPFLSLWLTRQNPICLAAFLLALLWNGQAGAAPSQILGRSLPAEATGLPAIGRLPGTTNLDLTIGLPFRNQAGLGKLLQQLYDPTSPQFHHFLTPDQFNERFSPGVQDYEAVKTFARDHGLAITRTVRSRAILGVRGSVADIEKTFHVALRLYHHPTEPRTFYAPDGDLSLDLPVPVLSVAGLDDYIVPRPMSLRSTPASNQPMPVPASGSGPSGNYIGNDFRAAYVPGVALMGSGQSVALLEFDSGYYQSDITNYEALASLPNVPVQPVLLDGWGGGPGGGNDEVSLDIEMVISMAPGISSVSVVEGDYTDDILTELADPSQGEPLSCQLSASWTYGIDATSDQLFQRFAAQGQSFFNASGDSDAYCAENPVPTPAGDTNIISVGGTTLFTTGPGGAYVSESVWNWGDNIGGSGGITTYPIPPWQQGINMTTNLGSTTLRNIPDVALTANQVWVLYGDGESNSFGGTSCATPLWAAFTALVNQQAVSAGRPTMGFMNPALYALGKSASYAGLFNDVVVGNNANSYCGSLFPACPGYDLCTGWGSPTPALLSALSGGGDALQITPDTGFSASGGVGGPFTVTSMTLVLTNVGTNTLTWSLANSSAWLSAAPTGGTLSPGGPATAVAVSLNSVASNLTAGTYSATLAFTNLNDGFGQLLQFQLAVLTPPVITNQPAGQIVTDGTTAGFSVGVSGGLPLVYQWQFNSNNVSDGGSISGSATATLTVANVAPANAGYYRVLVTNPAGMALSSNALLTTLAGNVDHFTWSAIASPQTAGQPFPAGITAFDLDNVLATNFAGKVAVTGQGTTGGALVTNCMFNNAVPGYSYTGTFTWGYPFTPTNNLTVTHVRSFYGSQVWLWTSNGTVLANQAVAGAPGTWTETPLATPVTLQAYSNYIVAVYFNDSTYYYVSGLTNEFPDGTIASYSLYSTADGFPTSTDPGFWPMVGLRYTVGALSPVAVAPTYAGPFWGGVWNGNATVLQTASNVVLTAGDAAGHWGSSTSFNVILASNQPPIITVQPADQSVPSGGSATFALTAIGAPLLAYAWLDNGNPMAGATNSSFTTNNVPLSANASQFSCLVTNLYGAATSHVATLTVYTNLPVAQILFFYDWTGPNIFAIALTNLGAQFQYFNEAGEASFNNAVAAANPATTLVIVDATADTHTFPGLPAFIAGGGRAILYYWDLTTLESLAGAFDANAFASFTTPQPVYNWGGSPLFTGVGTPLTFQEIGLNIDGQQLQPIAGAQAAGGFVSSPASNQAAIVIGNSGLTILNGFTFEEAAPGSSNAVVQLAMNEITSLAVITAPPTIVSQPADATVTAGNSATFTIAAFGSPPLSYCWLDNGKPMAGATNSSFTITNVPLSANGSLFGCIVTNLYGVATSKVATLTVGLGSLVLNGGFELGSFADWTWSGNSNGCYVTTNSFYVHSGLYGAQLGPGAHSASSPRPSPPPSAGTISFPAGSIAMGPRPMNSSYRGMG